MLLASLCLTVLLPLWAADTNSQKAIDTARSVLTVRVYKAGLLSALGHEHEIRAAIREGAFDENKNTVEFIVDARTLRVLDADVSDKDRAEIQSTMLGPKVLDSAEFHEIRFRSTKVSRAGENRWTVQGDLTLHGQARPVKVDVERVDVLAIIHQRDRGGFDRQIDDHAAARPAPEQRGEDVAIIVPGDRKMHESELPLIEQD